MVRAPARICTNCLRTVRCGPLVIRSPIAPAVTDHENDRASLPQFRPTFVSVHSFSTSPSLSKKSSKASKQAYGAPSPAASSPATPGKDDPFDLSALTKSIADALTKLEDTLSKLRSGGRFNPEVLEGLRVEIVKGQGSRGAEAKQQEKVKVRLGDLAQVVPKGRMVQVMVGEAEHIKPITRALHSSTDTLSPLPPAPQNPLTILLPLPPPTADSRKAAVSAASVATQAAVEAVRNARAGQQKKLRRMELDRVVTRDVLEKAKRSMESTVEKAMGQVKDVGERGKSMLDGSNER
ncbi:MAG: hypothetical protein M1817_005093 [Caeruleum heppii]|nr:MAG: hypothetical protein M1817_005093 [Caeruleum heppii]